LFRNRFLWLAVFIVVFLQLLAVYFSPLVVVLDTTKPSLTDWSVICACGLSTIGIVEITKLIGRATARTEEGEGGSRRDEPSGERPSAVGVQRP
jgi:magnesium-transporting ATPase (P-type)